MIIIIHRNLRSKEFYRKRPYWNNVSFIIHVVAYIIILFYIFFSHSLPVFGNIDCSLLSLIMRNATFSCELWAGSETSIGRWRDIGKEALLLAHICLRMEMTLVLVGGISKIFHLILISQLYNLPKILSHTTTSTEFKYECSRILYSSFWIPRMIDSAVP